MEKIKTIISTVLNVLGALWLTVEIIDYFGGKENAEKMQSPWWVFILTSIAICIYKLWPKKRFLYLVDGRDISIELVIGDIFKEEGPIIVGSNTAFETSQTIIAKTSVQGLFSSKYFSDIRAINDQLSAQQPNRPVEFGTTVTVRGNNRIAYFCAIAEINNSGVARSNMENLRASLGGLWVYLSGNGEKSVLNIPVLGSGFSRISEPREEIIQEIVLSFLAAINDSSFCDGIRIVAHPKDVKKYGLKIEKITKFLEHHCQYAPKKPSIRNVGAAEI
ncbi:macro domain-containing protein [Aeromonas hydrophila]|uniref:macro domain-containing protein n=1 Tax=Aeromonas hydrophila TaxID=644 RepID=UPI003216B265